MEIRRLLYKETIVWAARQILLYSEGAVCGHFLPQSFLIARGGVSSYFSTKTSSPFSTLMSLTLLGSLS